MKQLERSKQTTYRWNRVDGTDIYPGHISLLDEDAEARIAEMVSQGFSCGELHADYDDGFVYSGWWQIGCAESA